MKGTHGHATTDQIKSAVMGGGQKEQDDRGIEQEQEWKPPKKAGAANKAKIKPAGLDKLTQNELKNYCKLIGVETGTRPEMLSRLSKDNNDNEKDEKEVKQEMEQKQAKKEKKQTKKKEDEQKTKVKQEKKTMKKKDE
jgi:hypothetical protein